MQLLSTTPLKPMILTGIRLFNHAMTTASQHDTVITFPVTSLTVSSHLPFLLTPLALVLTVRKARAVALKTSTVAHTPGVKVFALAKRNSSYSILFLT